MVVNLIAEIKKIFQGREIKIGPLHGLGLIGSCFVIITFLAIAMFQANQLYVIDDATFPYGAEGILKEGAPYFYNGETRPRDLGMWHPPLYIYSLAAHMYFFGTSRISVRIFGMLTVLVGYLFGLRIIRRVAPNLSQFGYVAFSAFLLWNPLILSGSLIPDIDGTVGIIGIATSLWLATLIIQEKPSKRLFWTSIGIWLFIISTKFTLALLFIPIFLMAAMLSKENKHQKLISIIGSALIGSVLFLGIYFLLSFMVDFPVRAPFEYFVSGLQRTQGQISLIRKVFNQIFSPWQGVLFFLTPGLLITGIFGSLFILFSKTTSINKRLIGLYLFSSLLIILGYAAITGSPFTFPKYWGIAVLPLSINATLLLTDKAVLRFFDYSTKDNRSRLLNLTLLITLTSVILGSIYLSSRPVNATRDIFGLLLVTVVYFIIVFFVALIIHGFQVRSSEVSHNKLLLASIIISIVFATIMASLTINIVYAKADYSTRYYFSERGLAKVTAYLYTQTPSDSYIISAKDIGLQSSRLFFEDSLILSEEPNEVRKILTNNPAKYLVTRKKWDYSESVYPFQFEVLKEFFTPIPDQPAEDFIIWTRN